MNLTVINKILQYVTNKTGSKPEPKRIIHTGRRGGRVLAAVLLTICLLVMTACGGTKTAGQADNTGSGDGTVAEALADVNEIPEDGIITKEQFATVAGEDKQIQFTGETGGISYVWTFDAKQIQNPQDQNLKIAFTTEGLDDIKKAANNANDALKMTMEGQGLICVPTLTVMLPESWQSDTGLLLKEQNGQLAKMSDVTIDSQAAEQAQQSGQETDAAQQDGQAASAAPGAGTTVLTMTVTSLDGDCYVVGGITGSQNKGAAAANGGNADTAAGGETASGNTGSGNSAAGNAATGSSDAASAGDSGQETGGDNSGGDVKNNDVKNDDIKNGDTANSGSAGSGSGTSSSGSSTGGSGHTCTISISCSTILNNMDNLTDGKEEFVPSDGWILPATTVEFNEGDSVHDVLKAVCKENGIHMESTYTPMYDSAYVEGINQLYEFDCGELSGWMYNVNGWFPNYGCSKYTVSDGDVINWVYTCDLGKDVGDNSMY